MLKIKFAVVGIMKPEQSVPADVESPVPFEVGQEVYHNNPAEPIWYEVCDTRWVVGGSPDGFYQEVSIEVPKSKK